MIINEGSKTERKYNKKFVENIKIMVNFPPRRTVVIKQ